MISCRSWAATASGVAPVICGASTIKSRHRAPKREARDVAGADGRLLLGRRRRGRRLAAEADGGLHEAQHVIRGQDDDAQDALDDAYAAMRTLRRASPAQAFRQLQMRENLRQSRENLLKYCGATEDTP